MLWDEVAAVPMAVVRAVLSPAEADAEAELPDPVARDDEIVLIITVEVET